MNKAMFRELHKRSLDFLVAVDATTRTTRALPPHRAARAGLTAAWRAWVDVLRRRDGESVSVFQLRADGDFGPPEAGAALTELLVEAMRVHDPVRLRSWQSSEVMRLATLGFAAGLYLARPNVVVEPTLALQKWLKRTDIGEEISTEMFQLPKPAVFLHFGPEMSDAVDSTLWAHIDEPVITIGVYLFDTRVGSRRDLVFIPVGARTSQPGSCDLYQTIQFVIEDERDPLMDHVRKTALSAGAESKVLEGMVQMCIKVMLYLRTAGAVCTTDSRGDEAMERLKRVGDRKASIVERRLSSRYNQIIAGPQAISQKAENEVTAHWRRGHLRMQPYGPQSSLRKLIFVAPVLVGAERFNAGSI
jgi:hypothetical protein